MNSTIAKLAVAAPLVTIGLTLVPAAAMATVPGPGVISMPKGPVGPQGPGDITTPKPDPVKPHGPGDITAPKPGPVVDPKGPGDITAPKPGPVVDPKGPGDITAPKPCPTHGVDCDGKDDDFDEDVTVPTGEDRNDVGDSIALPKRIDAGEASAAEQGGDLELAWLIAGGALATASGVALAVRARRRTA